MSLIRFADAMVRLADAMGRSRPLLCFEFETWAPFELVGSAMVPLGQEES